MSLCLISPVILSLISSVDVYTSDDLDCDLLPAAIVNEQLRFGKPQIQSRSVPLTPMMGLPS